MASMICFNCLRSSSQRHHQRFVKSKAGSDETLAGIPVTVYRVPALYLLSGCTDNCSICLEEFNGGDKIRVLPKCKHMFHKDCIDQWLPLRSLNCPVCRDRTIQKEAKRTNWIRDDHRHSYSLLSLGFSNNSIL